MKCFCGKEFNQIGSFVSHIKTKHSESFASLYDIEYFVASELYGKDIVDSALESYKQEEVSADELRKSVNIIRLLDLLGIKRTNSQEKKTKRYREKYKKSMEDKYGIGITNPSQAKSVQEKKEATVARKHGSYENYLNSQRIHMKCGFNEYVQDEERIAITVKKIESTCLEKYGHINFGAGEEAKKKRIESHRKTINTWDYEERLQRTSKARESVNHRGGFSSKPEKRIRHCLTELDIEFKTNVHMWNYNYDLVFDSFIIEVQGDMWHASPLKYKATDLIMGKMIASDLWEKDKRKKMKAEGNGYTLIEIWEHEITKQTDESLIEIVNQKLKDNGYDFNR